MKIKNSDNWAYKMGLVGFDRILQYNKDSSNLESFNYVVEEDFIEFDDSLLDNFEEYYFNYFLGTYNSAKEVCRELDLLLLASQKQDLFKATRDKIIKQLNASNDKVKKMVTPSYVEAKKIEKEISNIKKFKDLDSLLKSLESYESVLKELNFLDEIETISSISNEIKSEDNFEVQLKLCKELIKKTNPSIMKIKLNIYDDMVEITNKVKKSTDVNDLTNLIESYKKHLNNDYVNKINSLNKFKRILSDNFFGQEGFLNSSLSKLSVLEQQERVKSKYVLPVKNYLYLKNIQTNNTAEDILNILKTINHYDDEVTKKFCNTLKTNCKTLGNEYINCFENQDSCILCEDEYSIGHIFTESSFIPLAVSNKNILNLFWDLNTNRPICPICQLILFCAPAGATSVIKNYISSKDFSDKSYQAFISQEGSLVDLISINNDFINRTSSKKSFDNSLGALLLNYLDVQRKISLWQLQNILYIEFNVDYKSKNTKLNYMSISYPVSMFLSKKENIFLIKSIEKIELQKEVLDSVLSGKNLRNIIFKNMRDFIKYKKGSDIIAILKIQKLLNLYKEGVESMGIKTKDYNKNFDEVVKQGVLLRRKLYKTKKENKRDSIIYKLSNLAKARNSKDMFDFFVRLYLSYGMEMPCILQDIKKESVLDMEDIAQAFIAGLLSQPDYDSKKTNNKNTETIEEQ